MIVKLNSKNSDYSDLSENKSYFIIWIEADDYRILNDAGKPYLYPPEIFDIVDSQHPSDWVTEFGQDGEEYSYPLPLNKVGFFKDFFEQKQERISIFWRVVNQMLAKAA